MKIAASAHGRNTGGRRPDKIAGLKIEVKKISLVKHFIDKESDFLSDLPWRMDDLQYCPLRFEFPQFHHERGLRFYKSL